MRRRSLLAFCFLLAGACSTTPVEPPVAITDEDVLARYVGAWIEGGDALLATVTGADAMRLVTTLDVMQRGHVTRATIEGVERVPGSAATLDGIVGLHFSDGARLEVTPHVEIVDERVRAMPQAITDELTEWRDLNIEAFGSATRGDILDSDGGVLASGPRLKRAVTRSALEPAVGLIDESLNERLAAKRGRRLVVENPRAVFATSRPADGQDVITSVDDGLQAAAEKVFGKLPGALIAVDPPSGGIRALISNPAPDAPHRSPASSAYSPGSTFKLVTAAAALESSVVDIDTVVPCPAEMSLPERQIENFRGIGYGPISFEKAFSVSCNTAFARVGMSVGSDRLLRMASSFGIDVGPTVEPGGIAIPRSESELAVFSFGASGSLLTPLQIAGIGAAIARGGTWVAPDWTDEPTQGTRVFGTSTADDLVTMMEEVVTTGTGRNAAISGVQIAGKTGTAETEIGENVPTDAWFVAIAPSRDATLALVTFLPSGGLGGGHAAIFAHDFLETTLDIWN